jgi:hypothetical protein
MSGHETGARGLPDGGRGSEEAGGAVTPPASSLPLAPSQASQSSSIAADALATHVSAKTAFERLDARLCGLFDGDLAGKMGFTASLVTLDTAQRAITALLGPGEIFAPDAGTVILALWPGSRANRNLGGSGRATLTFVEEGCFYQLYLVLARSIDADGLIYHEMTLESGEGQTVPYATLTSGIRYDLADRDATLLQWQRQLSAMRALGRGGV